MRNKFSALMSRCRGKFTAMAAAGALLVPAALSIAQPPPMGTVTFPIDEASIATSVSAAGATVLLVIFPVIIGFALVWKVLFRTKSSI
jgi:hypothetical protein